MTDETKTEILTTLQKHVAAKNGIKTIDAQIAALSAEMRDFPYRLVCDVDEVEAIQREERKAFSALQTRKDALKMAREIIDPKVEETAAKLIALLPGVYKRIMVVDNVVFLKTCSDRPTFANTAVALYYLPKADFDALKTDPINIHKWPGNWLREIGIKVVEETDAGETDGDE